MADDSNHRYRTTDPFARGAPGSGGYPPAGQGQGGRAAAPNHAQQGNDPLAELARLIGQNGQLSDFDRDGARTHAARDPRRPNGPAQDWQTGGAANPYRATGSHDGGNGAYPPHDQYRAHADPRIGGNGVYPPPDPRGARPDDPYRAQPDPRYAGNGALSPYERYDAGEEAPYPPNAPRYDDGRGYGGNGYADPNYADPAFGDSAVPARPHEYEDYEQTRGSQRGYEGDYYRDDPNAFPPGEEAYEDAAPVRRRGGMMTVLAVVGLAVVGTAAAFGYRAVFGTSGKTGTPPVIRADATPKKVVTASERRDPQTGKLIYDRVGSAGQGEKVVAREELPVDVKVQPRVVFPGPTANSAAAAPSVNALAPAINGGATGEPKKIKTVTIRSDQPTAANVPTARAAPSARAGAPEPNAALSRSQAAPQAQAGGESQDTSGGPLSLAPPTVARSAPQPTRKAAQPLRTASAPAAISAPAATSAVAGGGYTVQVSSQRSEADAQSSFRALQAKFPNILGGRQAIIRRADLGDKGTYYRAQVGPFATAEQASELCNGLKAAGGQCIVQRN